MKQIALLGSTGSIGTQTLDIIQANPDRFKLVALAGGFNASIIIEQVLTFKPDIISVGSKEIADHVRHQIPEHVKVYFGQDGLVHVATYEKVDTVVTAVVGSIGLRPTLAAIEHGKDIALANKETLVTAGDIVMNHVHKYDVSLLPIDSEHSAIMQCLQGEQQKAVEEIILTASGGSFRHMSREELVNVTIEQALQHPNWSMGAKITIDSATMMNKGLEVIETHWLFDVSYDQIKVLLHQESMIHSMVVFQDSSVMAQLGTPDMRVPIQYALSYPDRIYFDSPRLNLAEVGKLHFQDMDEERYPCLRMAYECGQKGGTYPTVLNAANETAVQLFLEEQISFIHIEAVIEETLAKHDSVHNPVLEEIEWADKWARQAASLIKGR